MEETSVDQNTEIVSKRKNLLVFWLRMLGWIATGTVAPITTFAIKFGLFTDYGYGVTVDEMGNVIGAHVAINGWGIVSIILTGYTLFTILNSILDAQAEYSMSRQCLAGIKSRILPIAIAMGVIYFLDGVLDQILFCLGVIGLSQIAAVPLNPLPKWKYEKTSEEDYSDVFSQAFKLAERTIAKKRGTK